MSSAFFLHNLADVSDTLFEWVRQIKAHVAVIRSEQEKSGSNLKLAAVPHPSKSTDDLAAYVEKAEMEQRLRQKESLRRDRSPQPRSSSRGQAETEAMHNLEGGYLSPSTSENGQPVLRRTRSPGSPCKSAYKPPPISPPPSDLSDGWQGQFAFEASPTSALPSTLVTPAESPAKVDVYIQGEDGDAVQKVAPIALEAEVAGLNISDVRKNSPIPPVVAALPVGNEDAASVSSKGSSAKRRIKKAVPAMDLMAEVATRPEMNYERFMEETEPIIEDRPRKIRFQ